MILVRRLTPTTDDRNPMNKRRLPLVFILFFISTSLALASEAGNALLPLLNRINTLQANFTQTVYDNHNQAVQQSFGTLVLSRPGKFRWDVKKPIPQLIVANLSRLWIYDPDLEQVTIRAFSANATDAPALLLSHPDATLEATYTVSSIQKKQSSLQWFSLKPKKKDSLFDEVQLGFQQGQLQEMRLLDHLGHTTQIEFNHVQVNGNVSPTLFTFKIPKQADVIDETRH